MLDLGYCSAFLQYQIPPRPRRQRKGGEYRLSKHAGDAFDEREIRTDPFRFPSESRNTAVEGWFGKSEDSSFQKNRDTWRFRRYLGLRTESDSMRKEKLKAKFKSNRSIPNRDTLRPGNMKEGKEMAHHAPVRRAASKARGY